MDNLADYEIDTILEGLERVARDAKTPDERAMADVLYCKILNTLSPVDTGIFD